VKALEVIRAVCHSIWMVASEPPLARSVKIPDFLPAMWPIGDRRLLNRRACDAETYLEALRTVILVVD
jgi:hypothetical protein